MRILKSISEPGLFLQIEGPEEGGVAGIQIDNVYVEAAKLRRAWEEFSEVEYQESPFESFMGAVNVAARLESQFTQADGTRLVTIDAVLRSAETQTYGIRVLLPGPVSGGPDRIVMLWRNRDVASIRELVRDMQKRTPR